jgi:hypothetical protein
MYGVVSVVLFALLALYSNNLVEWARLTRAGEKLYFIVPIIIAFVFSFVHGNFTSYFWDALGFKAANNNKSKK